MLPVSKTAIAMPIAPVDGNPISTSASHRRHTSQPNATVSATPVADTDTAARPVAAVNPIPSDSSNAGRSRSDRVASAGPRPAQ